MTTQAARLVVRKSVTVPLPVEEAFDLFTERIGSWWTMRTHSLGGEQAQTAVLEGKVDGRLYERQADGTEADWGRVIVFEPPHRLVLAWDLKAGTEVEVRFTRDAESTRVDLEHRGWERLGEEADQWFRSYEAGWPTVLNGYVEAASQ
jgi:uncharacterized protein YndB with AHSA1/START domain